MSIFMVIVEDAYVTAKYATNYSWLIELEDIEKKQDNDESSQFRNDLKPGAISISVAASENDLRGSQELRPPNEQKLDLSKVTS